MISSLILFVLLVVGLFVYPVSAQFGFGSPPAWPTDGRWNGKAGQFLATINDPEYGGDRTFHVFIPNSYGTGSVPHAVVINAHGVTDFCASWFTRNKLASTSNDSKRPFDYITIIPCGSGTMRGWNAGACCVSGVNDVKLFRDIVTKFLLGEQTGLNIDPTRIFMSGFSNGALMTEMLMCQASDLFRAYGSGSGQLTDFQCQTNYNKPGAKRRSILKINGDADTTVQFSASGPDTAKWRTYNQCPSTPPIQTLNMGAYTNQLNEGCAENNMVERVIVAGGGHVWYSDSNFDNTMYILKFFQRVVDATGGAGPVTPSTTKPTQTPATSPTEKATPPPTQPPTQKATQPPTQSATLPPTQPPTQPPPVTPKPTEAATDAPPSPTSPPVTPVPATPPPVVTERPPVVTERPPVVTERPPVVTERPPIVTQRPPVVTDRPPVVTDRPPVLTDRPPIVTNPPPITTDTPPIVTNRPPTTSKPTFSCTYSYNLIQRFTRYYHTDLTLSTTSSLSLWTAIITFKRPPAVVYVTPGTYTIPRSRADGDLVISNTADVTNGHHIYLLKQADSQTLIEVASVVINGVTCTGFTIPPSPQAMIITDTATSTCPSTTCSTSITSQQCSAQQELVNQCMGVTSSAAGGSSSDGGPNNNMVIIIVTIIGIVVLLFLVMVAVIIYRRRSSSSSSHVSHMIHDTHVHVPQHTVNFEPAMTTSPLHQQGWSQQGQWR